MKAARAVAKNKDISITTQGKIRIVSLQFLQAASVSQYKNYVSLKWDEIKPSTHLAWRMRGRNTFGGREGKRDHRALLLTNCITISPLRASTERYPSCHITLIYYAVVISCTLFWEVDNSSLFSWRNLLLLLDRNREGFGPYPAWWEAVWCISLIITP